MIGSDRGIQTSSTLLELFFRSQPQIKRPSDSWININSEKTACLIIYPDECIKPNSKVKQLISPVDGSPRPFFCLVLLKLITNSETLHRAKKMNSYFLSNFCIHTLSARKQLVHNLNRVRFFLTFLSFSMIIHLPSFVHCVGDKHNNDFKKFQ